MVQKLNGNANEVLKAKSSEIGDFYDITIKITHF